MDCHQKSVPLRNEIRVNQLTPNPPDSRGNKSQLIHPNSSHNRPESCQQALSGWLFYLYLYNEPMFYK